MSTDPRQFVFNHTMLRVKDPDVSLAFYREVLGFELMHRLDFDEMRFSLYFLLDGGQAAQAPEEPAERVRWLFSRRGVLEMTHNWGTEAQDDFAYHDGNAEPQGFGHICVSVPDLDAAIAHLDGHGVSWVKRPEDGKMRDIAFIRDPDGYWVEVLEAARMVRIP